jgi:hypothetical protein
MQARAKTTVTRGALLRTEREAKSTNHRVNNVAESAEATLVAGYSLAIQMASESGPSNRLVIGILIAEHAASSFGNNPTACCRRVT